MYYKEPLLLPDSTHISPWLAAMKNHCDGWEDKKRDSTRERDGCLKGNQTANTREQSVALEKQKSEERERSWGASWNVQEKEDDALHEKGSDGAASQGDRNFCEKKQKINGSHNRQKNKRQPFLHPLMKNYQKDFSSSFSFILHLVPPEWQGSTSM